MALKVAVLINTYPSPYSNLVTNSFTTAVAAASPDSTVDFYNPIQSRTYPDPNVYDLIVLSGGTADPSGDDEWVVAIRRWLQTMTAEHPRQKVLGICWGHQQLCVAFGGVVGDMESAELGVTTISLTPAGQTFFPSLDPTYAIHEFHRREVKTPAKGFIELAAPGQCFVNESNTVLSFQGHPEVDETLAKGMLAGSPKYMGIEEEKYREIQRKMEIKHDGEKLWERIVKWVGE